MTCKLFNFCKPQPACNPNATRIGIGCLQLPVPTFLPRLDARLDARLNEGTCSC